MGMQTGASFQWAQFQNDRGMWPIVITGQESQIEMACRMLRTKMKKAAMLNPKTRLPSGMIGETREIPVRDIAWITGSGGEGLGQIALETGAELDFKNSKGESKGKGKDKGKAKNSCKTLLIIGTKEEVAKANKLVDSKLGWNDWNNNDGPQLVEPKSLHQARAKMVEQIMQRGTASEAYQKNMEAFVYKFELGDDIKSLFQMMPEEVGSSFMGGSLTTNWLNRYVADYAETLQEALVQEVEDHSDHLIKYAAMLTRKVTELVNAPVGREWLLA